MNEFFAGADYTGEPFKLLGTIHLIVLGIITAINLLVIYWRFHSSELLRRCFRYGLATLLLVNETLYHVWRVVNGEWTIQLMLPLHACAMMVYLSAIMLITKNGMLYQFLYFMGIGASIQALVTPEADLYIYGFPHFRFFETFIAHGSIFTAAIYMTIVERYRPSWKSIWKIFVGMNGYMVVVWGINTVIGSNYLFVSRKPDMPSLLDHLGPWPWYIIGMEVIGLITCLALYFPYAILDWKETVSARRARKQDF